MGPFGVVASAMGPGMEEFYLSMALKYPDLMCREAPVDVLEAASTVDEPTQFLVDFFGTGHTQWLSRKHGREAYLGKERLRKVVVVLWRRACQLHTSYILGIPDPDLDKPFFTEPELEG